MSTAFKRRALCLGFGAWAVGVRTAFARAPAYPYAIHEQRSFALGTTVRAQAVAGDPALAQAACSAALRAIQRVDRLMSLYDADSEICRLNRDAALDHPDAWTLAVFEHAQEQASRSFGAFDVTVQPLWKLFRSHADRSAVPPGTSVDAVRARVGWRGLRVGAARLQLARPGMAVTLNGIAQGFAADRAVDAMRAAGALAGLVDAGELATLGAAPSGRPWSVALEAPQHGREELIALDGCVATSGDSVSWFTPDRRHHHIFDPRKGWSPTELSTVSVVAATATQADAWSTAIMVGGETLARRALELGEVRRVWLVDKQGRAGWVV
ncbi:MAG: FAD:protein FMN transferase [Burkholderiaceae bacterium]